MKPPRPSFPPVSLLTIGDGIATQLPALVISIATGIIVTRSAADKELSTEVFRQLSSFPRILLIVAIILCALLLLPGMPKWPIAILAVGAIGLWLRLRRGRADVAEETSADETADVAPALSSAQPLSIAMGKELGEAWADKKIILLDRIATLRDAQEKALGLGFPPIKLIDGPQLGAKEYEIRLFGTRYASSDLELDHVLAIKGEQSRQRLEGRETRDPAFGLPAVWIEEKHSNEAREAGYTLVDPITVFVTHLSEVLRTSAAQLLTRSMTVKLLDEVRARQPGLVEELVPALLSVSDAQKILQNLVTENVSIAAIDLIVEHLVDLARVEKEAGALTELLRQRLGYAICDRLKGRHRDLAVISLDPRLENQIQANLAANVRRDALSIDPKLADRLIRKLVTLTADMLKEGREPVLLCGVDIRRHVRALTRRSLSKLNIVSVSEIPTNIDLRSFGVVRLEVDEPVNRVDVSKVGAFDA